jgi:hypothetical protein
LSKKETEGCAFAGAVVPEQTENFTPAHFQRKVLQRGLATK